MIDFSSANVLTALGVTAAAGCATVIGSLMVLFSKTPSPRMLSFGLAFAGGAMVFVSLSEILTKSVQAFTVAHGDKLGFTYATFAFLFGVISIALIDHFIPNPHESLEAPGKTHGHGCMAHGEGDAVAAAIGMSGQEDSRYLRRVGLLTAIAITAHNFPEGLATFFAMLDNAQIGLPLAMAIAVHNIPEGIAIAVPIYFATQSKAKALLASLTSGLAEPAGALIGYVLLAPFLSDAVYGAVFGVIAGVMVFLALDELLPAAKKYAQGHETVYGLVSGMAVLALSIVLFKW